MAHKSAKRTTNNNNTGDAILAHRVSTPPFSRGMAFHLAVAFVTACFGARACHDWHVPHLFVGDNRRVGEGLELSVGGWWNWQLDELHEGPFGQLRVVATVMCCHTGLGVSQHTRHVFDLVLCWDGVYRALHENAECLWAAQFGHFEDEGLRCAVA